jgi:hypothetical protein
MVKVRATRCAIALLVASALTLAACGGSDDGKPEGFAATPSYLRQVVASSRTTPHTFEARLSLGLPGPDDDAPVTTGRSDGRWIYTRSDSRRFVEASGEQLPFDPARINWVTETVSDGRTFYMKAPFIKDVADARPDQAVPPVVGVLRKLGNRWAQVDLAALGDPVPVDVGKWLPGTRDLGVRQALQLLLTARKVEDEGPATLRGVKVRRLAADIGFADLLEAEGVDVTSALANPSTPKGLASVINHAELQAQLWIDGDGHIRRLSVDTGSTFEDIAKVVGTKGVPDAYKIQGIFTFAHYGDRSIDVAPPPAGQSKDVTRNLHAIDVGQ